MKIRNIRSKTEKREIVQYLILREKILHLTTMKSKTEREKRIAKARHSEISMLLNSISKDTIRAKVRKFHQQVNLDSNYKNKIKEKNANVKEEL